MLYKFTGADGSSTNGGWGRWHLGRWRTVSGPLLPCRRGLHMCREKDLVLWLAPALWEAEVDGEVIEADDKVVARKARIVRRVEAWDDRTARLFAADCAEHVLPLFEAALPGDARPRTAIETARRFANGEVTDEERAAARAAERAAAWDAAGAAEREWQTARLMAYLAG